MSTTYVSVCFCVYVCRFLVGGKFLICLYWSQRWESNPRPLPYEGNALATELRWQCDDIITSSSKMIRTHFRAGFIYNHSMLLAEAVSIIFGVPWIFIIGWVLLFSSGLVKSQIIFMFIAFFILYFLVPTIYMLYSLKKGYIEDFDMTKRQERYGILSVLLVAHLMNLVLAFLYMTPEFIEKLLIVAIVYTTIYLITFYWKISLHMSLNMVGITFINMATGWHYIWLYVLIPLVAWSRLKLEKHTPAQLFWGSVIPYVEIAVIRLFF